MFRKLLMTTVIASALLAGPALAAGKTLKIVEPDMEGGGGTLYVTPEGVSVLVDTGTPPGGMWTTSLDGANSGVDRIVTAAKALGVKKIDYVIITHYHGDHVGGVGALLDAMPVGVFIDHGPNREMHNSIDPPGQPGKTQIGYLKYLQLIKGHKRIIAKAGQVFHFGSLTDTIVIADGKPIAKPLKGAGGPGVECDLPSMAEDGGIENAKSIGSLFTFGKVKIAAFGDLTWDREHDLVCPVNKVGHVNILIVDNHGLGTSNNPGFIHTIAPEIAIMGNGSKKGSLPAPVAAVNSSPGLQGFWRVHEPTLHPELAGDPNYLANLGPNPSHGYALTLDVARDGEVTVTNTRNGFSKTYKVN
jgi:beta-lactamase superfamily II metal-dependent hydrolase